MSPVFSSYVILHGIAVRMAAQVCALTWRIVHYGLWIIEYAQPYRVLVCYSLFSLSWESKDVYALCSEDNSYSSSIFIVCIGERERITIWIYVCIREWGGRGMNITEDSVGIWDEQQQYRKECREWNEFWWGQGRGKNKNKMISTATKETRTCTYRANKT